MNDTITAYILENVSIKSIKKFKTYSQAYDAVYNGLIDDYFTSIYDFLDEVGIHGPLDSEEAYHVYCELIANELHKLAVTHNMCK